jgi:hypothetical protein
MIDVAHFIAHDLDMAGQTPRQRDTSGFGTVPWSVVCAIHDAGGRRCAEYWALLIVMAARRELRLRYSQLREAGGWVRVSAALMPRGERLATRLKREALLLLERAGVVEVRRSPHAAPCIRFLDPDDSSQ